ncbi:threonine ammonia-lyase, biosynthetic [soil metagenome]
MDTLEDYLKRSLLSRVYDVARETAVEPMPRLAARVGGGVWIKREDEQPTFSFKIRGAYNKMALMRAEDLKRGVITASAGNHAQGVALAAQKLGCRAVIVMPSTTPTIKIDAVKALGGEVELHGDNFDAASRHARDRAAAEHFTYVHGFDDPDVIAGQGTVGLEILRQHPGPLDAIFVAVGGGGLIAGIGAVVKSLRPEVRVIAVEAEDSASMTASLSAGEPVKLTRVGRFADGVAVAVPGEETFRIAQQVVDECVVVSNDAICAAIKDVFEDRRAILEPAGAVAIAGLKAYAKKHGPGEYLAIASGANVNFDSLRHVSERAEIGERRETIFAATVPDQPGAFRSFCNALGPRAVTEFNYRFESGRDAQIYVGVRTENVTEMFEELRHAGYPVLDLTDNETAKLHVRYMVGGRADAEHERLLRFEFPERAGALLGFLNTMKTPWNISLFHYRNHGSDIGRVLTGIQVPPEDATDFAEFLAQLGFAWTEVTDDAACELFLR